jgi:hypothetical protein
MAKYGKQILTKTSQHLPEVMVHPAGHSSVEIHKLPTQSIFLNQARERKILCNAATDSCMAADLHICSPPKEHELPDCDREKRERQAFEKADWKERENSPGEQRQYKAFPPGFQFLAW